MKLPMFTTHDMNFDPIIMDLIVEAYKNDKKNQQSGTGKLKGTGKNKKSHMQNGKVAVACLLLYIIMESMIRRKFYFLSDVNRASAHTKSVFDRYKVINGKSKNLNVIASYFAELKLIRDAIVHAYFFEGEIVFDDDHEIIGLNEKIVSGGDKRNYNPKMYGRLTPILRLHTAPNQISFKDIATYYIAINYILKDANLAMPDTFWPWQPEEYIEPIEWLERAMKSLRYGGSKVWLKVLQKLNEPDSQDFIKGLDDAGLGGARF